MASERYDEDVVLRILRTTEEINHLKDVDAILDRILLEARRLAQADAGSIFLLEKDQLAFSYVHNDTLFREDENNAALYSAYTVGVDDTSIVGYAALTGQHLVIDDAYAIPADRPYAFNPRFDELSGYRTRSILTIPLKTFDDRLVGVMQLINAKEGEGRVVPFSRPSQLYVPLFGNHAAVAIERGCMNRELILRMMKMAELRDPGETGAHVQRVGAYSAEIFQRWALNRGWERRVIKAQRDLIRLAAMLHDVGKVGISDAILKKPGRLTPEEFEVMKLHTVYGARLFVNTTSALDRMSVDIALNHHEKWAGGGYPGVLPDFLHSDEAAGQPKRGEEIPAAARIVALADVFDALAARRCYKEPWPEERILTEIRASSGRHFDPEVVAAFFQIYEVITAIQRRFPD
ncbi:MAG: HD domain-containing phosphohydrolase [Thermodesulfobacteriota bacterium]